MVQRALVGAAKREFEGADLGDRRRSARLTSIAGTLEEQPARGFPRLLGSDAALEAFYRFINNRSFGAEDIVAPHIAATAERAAEAAVVVAVHDTTLVEYGTKRKDLGVTTRKTRAHGFVAQVTLLVSETDGLPLGVASGYGTERLRSPSSDERRIKSLMLTSS